MIHRTHEPASVGGRRCSSWRVGLLLVGAAAGALAGLGPAAAPAGEVTSTAPAVIQSLLPAVVNIDVRKQEPPPTTAAGSASAAPAIKAFVGSGFVVAPSGLILTNYHVVEDAFQIMVTFSDGTTRRASVVNGSRLADLAIVQVAADHPLPAARWGDSAALQVGDQVFAAGNPFGLGMSVSAGIVSGLNRNIQNSPYDDLIQTDATINHGNSGGPLFDMKGEVVGVNADIISPTPGSSGLGFAIPETSARFVVHQLLTYGWIHPGWIGVKVQQVTPQLADAMGLSRASGSLVGWVVPNGPADAAHLVIGDRILGFNGIEPSDERALLREIAHTSPDTTVALKLQRGGTQRTVPVTVELWPRDQWESLDKPIMTVMAPHVAIPPDLGLSLAALSPQARSQSELPASLNGVLVTAIASQAGTDGQGLAKDDIILRVQDTPVATPDDVLSGIQAARADKRSFVLMLVWQKVRKVPGPEWLALSLGSYNG